VNSALFWRALRAPLHAHGDKMHQEDPSTDRHASFCRQPDHDVPEHNFLDRFALPRAMASRLSSTFFPTIIRRPRWLRGSRSMACARCSSTLLPATGRPASAASRRCPAASKNFATVFFGFGVRPGIAMFTDPRDGGHCAAGADRAHVLGVYTANLAWAAERARAAGIDLLIEPIALRNIPGFFLNRQEEAHAIVAEVGAPNLKILMDLFHCQVEEGDLAVRIRKYLADPKQTRVGHFQIAGVPERHEPDTGEVNYGYLFDLIDELGYEGWIGCEYIPAANTSAGLGWFKKQTAAR
jgi:hypothetical protein